ncbi:hypothetical protein MKK69_27845 [Methylobacterium sp. J-026]|uniref:hypothetical protein n=1 Tax=Methylobacterium sp. J-026 TaxID=2836624 RepID=UPI001FB9C316|nr:hypothetical protein [Methylobacterium sp. J-026]MCJ2137812.1 hypothetical protein [Methylobacterium sp. J-026]
MPAAARCRIHHRRGQGRGVETHIVSAGMLDLRPPGLRLPVADLFADLPPPADPAA